MQYLIRFRTAIFTTLLLCFCASASFRLTLFRPVNSSAQAQTVEPSLKQFSIPALVHGFISTTRLPHGDLFCLPRPLTVSIADAPASLHIFEATETTFGAPASSFGALPEMPAFGFTLANPGERAVALTCGESIWDGNLVLTGTPNSYGDQIRIFLRSPDGKKIRELMKFEARYDGYELIYAHPELRIFVNNRFAQGEGLTVKSTIPYEAYVGKYGQRTGLITYNFPMDAQSELHGCFQFGVEVVRGNLEAMTGVVIPDLVVNRDPLNGDRDNAGVGLLAQLTGGYPSGVPCQLECPFEPPPQPTPTVTVTPTPTPTPTVTPTSTPSATPTPGATATPSATPSPSATPNASPTPTPSPTATPTPAPTPAPTPVPTPTPSPVPTPTPEPRCQTVCFRSPVFYYLAYCHRSWLIPDGALWIGSVNANRPVGTRTLHPVIALRNHTGNEMQNLNREFVAAQLSILSLGAEGSPPMVTAMNSPLSCYGLNFTALLFNNGVFLSPASTLGELFRETRLALQDNRTSDMPYLTMIFEQLNGNNPYGACQRY